MTTAETAWTEAMKYEKRLETAYTTYGAWFFDSRGWGDLPVGTPLEWPVPFQELDARLLPLYNLGGVGLLLVCVLVLPNLVLWNAAALLGPGYAVGAGTSVTLTSSGLGAVPALPVLAALPPVGPRPGWLVALAVVPLVAGAVAGYATVAPRPDGARVGTLRTVLTAGAGSGALAGSAVAVGLLLSGGAIGPGRLGHTGPDVGLAVPLSIVVLAVGGAVGAAAAHYRGRRGADDAASAVPDTPDSTPVD
mgnify:CR=1 FL=1